MSWSGSEVELVALPVVLMQSVSMPSQHWLCWHGTDFASVSINNVVNTQALRPITV